VRNVFIILPFFLSLPMNRIYVINVMITEDVANNLTI